MPAASSAEPCGRAARTTPSRPTGTGCCWAGCGCRTGNWRPRPPTPRRVADASLHRRDALWAAALQPAIARRSGDSGAVQKHWYTAMEVLAEYSVDLFSLLPLGELWVAAARMRQIDRLQHTLDEAFALLDVVGQPGVVVGAAALGRRARRNPCQLAGVGGAARPGADGRGEPQRLREGTGGRRPHLAAGAGQSRRHRRGHRRGPVAVPIRTHLGRHPVGGPSRVADPRRARVRRHAAVRPRSQADDRHRRRAERRSRPDSRSADRLGAAAVIRAFPTASGRSPNCLLLGMPYRDIGSQLFISAKTVEHHVARIRRRLGAESRSEMLSMLRAMLATPS